MSKVEFVALGALGALGEGEGGCCVDRVAWFV